MSQTLIVQVWSDLLCPWCWIAERRFAKALGAFPHRDEVQVVLRSYRLMPGASVHTVEEMFARKGLSPLETQLRMLQMENIAAEEGLIYRLAGTQAGDTIDILRMVKFAQKRNLESELVHRIYRAYLSEQIPVLDRDMMLQLAGEVGLDPQAGAAMLDTAEFTNEVEEDERDARSRGIRGVPHYVFDDQVSLSGGQSSEAYLAALNQAWDHIVAAEPADSGVICGPGGCQLPA